MPAVSRVPAILLSPALHGRGVFAWLLSCPSFSGSQAHCMCCRSQALPSCWRVTCRLSPSGSGPVAPPRHGPPQYFPSPGMWGACTWCQSFAPIQLGFLMLPWPGLCKSGCPWDLKNGGESPASSSGPRDAETAFQVVRACQGSPRSGAWAGWTLGWTWVSGGCQLWGAVSRDPVERLPCGGRRDLLGATRTGSGDALDWTFPARSHISTSWECRRHSALAPGWAPGPDWRLGVSVQLSLQSTGAGCDGSAGWQMLGQFAQATL